MNFFRFASFSVVGGMVWVSSLTLAGYWFGKQEQVKRNFHLVIVAIIVISVLPVVIEFFKARRHGKKSAQEQSPQHAQRP
jgi:membrane-associated protein